MSTETCIWKSDGLKVFFICLLSYKIFDFAFFKLLLFLSHFVNNFISFHSQIYFRLRFRLLFSFLSSLFFSYLSPTFSGSLIFTSQASSRIHSVLPPLLTNGSIDWNIIVLSYFLLKFGSHLLGKELRQRRRNFPITEI